MKITLLTSKFVGTFQENVIKSILNSNHTLVEVVIDNRKPISLYKRLIKHLKKKRGGYVLILAFNTLLKRNKYVFNVESFAKNNNIPIYITQNPYSHKTLEKARSIQATIGVYLGGFGPLLKSSYLHLYQHGVLSYHHGNMRKYRGQPPFFWEFYNNEKEVGITVQKLTNKLDAGIPIEEITVPINESYNLKKFTKECYLLSIPMMVNALDKFDNNTHPTQNISELGKIYTIPNFRQWLFSKIKLMTRNIIKIIS